MRNKKIHFVVGDITVIGGVENVTRTLSEEFINRGAKVTIHSLYSVHNQKSFSPDIEVVNLGLIPPDREVNLFSKIKRLFLNGLILRNSIAKSSSQDILIFQGFYIAVHLPFFIGIRAKKIVCEHNSYDAPGRLSRFARALLYKLLSPKVVVLTESDQKKFSEIGIRDSSKILNPLPKFSIGNGSSLENKTLISLGRFTHQKRFDLMVEMMGTALKKRPDWKLKIQGAGEDIEKIKSAIANSDTPDQIELIPQGDPGPLYTEGSIFLMTSLFEGLPMTLIESMSHGIPTVAFHCSPGLSEVVDNDQTGYLVTMDDSKSFIDKVGKLMDDSTLRKRLGANALKSVEKYQLSRVIADWEKIIQ